MTPESPEDCLSEAAEFERLASLSKTVAARQTLQSMAFHWRKLAERARERAKERASERPSLRFPRLWARATWPRREN
jgi:hypothetical protein